MKAILQIIGGMICLFLIVVISAAFDRSKKNSQREAYQAFIKNMKKHEGGIYYELRKKAAKKAIFTEACDEIKSSEAEGRKIEVTCDDGKKVSYLRGALKPRYKAAKYKSDKYKSKRQLNSEAGAFDKMTCLQYIRQRVAFPASVKYSFLFGSSEGEGANGARIVRQDFEAKNAYGAMLPYSAYCTFQAGEKHGVINIMRR